MQVEEGFSTQIPAEDVALFLRLPLKYWAHLLLDTAAIICYSYFYFGLQ